MLVIFPFEKDFYAGFGMDVDYVGHPLLDRVKISMSREDFFQKHGVESSRAVVSLLPGSRTKEIRYHLSILLQTAQRLASERPMQFFLPLVSSANRDLVERSVQEMHLELPLQIIVDDTYNALGHSDLAVVSSGTATLEAAILERLRSLRCLRFPI
jgi:lipid-A-disaccharide synthase